MGAAPGAVEDPTPACPGGKTAADLASSRGHKGIAGYLAEADLIRHLSVLTVNENVMDSVAASIAAEKAIENATQVVPSDVAINENLSLKGSLGAVRKSAHAAALIQAALRARSFNHRQLTKKSNDISEVALDLVALGSLNKVRKQGHFEEYLHSAAAKIQQRYCGWKGRKEFLKIRSRIVKIQVILDVMVLSWFLHQIIVLAYHTTSRKFESAIQVTAPPSIHSYRITNLNITFYEGDIFIYIYIDQCMLGFWYCFGILISKEREELACC